MTSQVHRDGPPRRSHMVECFAPLRKVAGVGGEVEPPNDANCSLYGLGFMSIVHRERAESRNTGGRAMSADPLGPSRMHCIARIMTEDCPGPYAGAVGEVAVGATKGGNSSSDDRQLQDGDMRSAV